MSLSPVAQPCPRPPSGPCESSWARALAPSSEAERRPSGHPLFPPQPSCAPGPRGGRRAPSSSPGAVRDARSHLPLPPVRAACPRQAPAPRVASPNPLPGVWVCWGRACTTTKAEPGAWLRLGRMALGASCSPRTRATCGACAVHFLSTALPDGRSRQSAREPRAGSGRGCRGVQCCLRDRGSRAKIAGPGTGGEDRATDALRAHTTRTHRRFCSARGDPWLGRSR